MLVSIVIPAFQEELTIPSCLRSLLSQDFATTHPDKMEVIVVCNNCTDQTATVARSFAIHFAQHRIPFTVFELVEGGKPRALNHGDKFAAGAIRIYMDADVTCESSLVREIVLLLAGDEPRFASGTLVLAPTDSFFTKAYGEVWTRLRHFDRGGCGYGLYAVNWAGRRRWGSFPIIHSDDKYVRLNFQFSERVRAQSTYNWPLPEGLGNLIRVRRRWCEGNSELAKLYPALARLDHEASRRLADLCRCTAEMPIYVIVFVIVYCTAGMLASLNRGKRVKTWRRGR